MRFLHLNESEKFRFTEMTIFVDATLTLSWNRPPIGLVRVEIELLKRFLEGGQAKFVKFPPGSKQPVEVDRTTILKKLNQLKFVGQAVSDEQPLNAFQRLEGLRSWVQTLPRRRRFLFMTILIGGNFLVQCLLSFFKHSRAIAGNALSSLRIEKKEFRTRRLESTQNPRLLEYLYGTNENMAARCKTEDCAWKIFGENDVFFSVGNTWDYQNLAEIFNEKKRHGFRYAAMCYDLVPIKVPQFALNNYKEKFELYYSNLLWSADHIFSISQSSENDLIEYKNLNQIHSQQGFSIVNLGSMMDARSDGDALPKWIRKDDYILYVSTLERRKNHETVFNAYAELCKENPDEFPFLVFVGMPGWHTKDFIRSMNLDPRVRDSRGKSKVQILNNVNDASLNWLYANAIFSVYPSFYEGWGLPVAESLSNGTPVITSTGSSFSEVGAGFTIQIDPYDTFAWKDEINSLLENPGKLKLLRERTKQYVQHSWDTSFDQIGKKLHDLTIFGSGGKI